MKRLYLFAFLLVLIGAGCSESPLLPQLNTSSTSTPPTIEDTSTVIEIIPPPDEPLVEGVKRIEMKVDHFSFDPPMITVATGQDVEMTFTEVNGIHTFSLTESKVNEKIEAGKTIRFKAPKEPGHYSYFCNVGNHRELGMEGLFIVRERE